MVPMVAMVAMDLGPHAAFIVTAYAAALAIVAGLILWVVLDRRRLARAVAELEAQGPRQGSPGQGTALRSDRAREQMS
jgi:heme exporter protein D